MPVDRLAPPLLPPLSGEQRRLDAAAKEFEAVFIAQMLAPLFRSVSTPEVAGGGKSEEFWGGLLQENYARAIAERGGFGLADHVKASLIHLQGTRDIAARSDR